jgi:hypothetical protein
MGQGKHFYFFFIADVREMFYQFHELRISTLNIHR